MEKFLDLHENLEKCYLKIPYKVYILATDEARENTCKKERELLAEYVNSDMLSHESVLKERIEFYKGNCILFTT
jgi:hypothetical protein